MFNYNNFLNNSFFFTFYYGKLLAPRDMDCILVLWLVHSITTEFQASPRHHAVESESVIFSLLL